MIEVLMLLAVFATNKVLMLLAVFATNILKPISKVLEDYDGLMSLAELIVEGIFLLLVLKEFKMTTKSFEWQNEEWRNRKDDEATKRINKIIHYLLCDYMNGKFILNNDFGKKMSEMVNLQDELCEQYAKEIREYNKNREYNNLKQKTDQQIPKGAVILDMEFPRANCPWDEKVSTLRWQLHSMCYPLRIEALIKGYKKEYNKEKELSSAEIEILKRIHKIVFAEKSIFQAYFHFQSYFIFYIKWKTLLHRNCCFNYEEQEETKCRKRMDDIIKNIPETIIGTDIIRKIKIDYKSLEKMYDKMFFGKYDCE